MAAPITMRCRTRTRPAAISEPASEPTAMNVPSSPYSVGPLSKTSVAISADVIWKFSPKVPAKNTVARISNRSGRPRT